MSKKIVASDLIGKKFNKLTVIEEVTKDKYGHLLFRCLCNCGKEVILAGYKIRSGIVKSCGCLHLEASKKQAALNFTKHGESSSRLYVTWIGMKARCYNPNNINYKNYGGRGIIVCEEWKNNFLNFKKFMLENGYREESSFGECTLDRIDINGNYEPNNCRVISLKEQGYNKTNSRYIEYNGVIKTITEWAIKYDKTPELIDARLSRGWSMEDALSKPPRKIHTKATLHTINGETHTIKEWAEVLGMTKSVLKGRLKRHSLEDIINDCRSKQH